MRIAHWIAHICIITGAVLLTIVMILEWRGR